MRRGTIATHLLRNQIIAIKAQQQWCSSSSPPLPSQPGSENKEKKEDTAPPPPSEDATAASSISSSSTEQKTTLTRRERDEKTVPDMPRELPGIVKTSSLHNALWKRDSHKDNKSSSMVDKGDIVQQARISLHKRYNPFEHFLLADLDYDKDGLLFGESREEFDKNVKKMKKVIIEYSRWERKDNYYRYATWAVQLTVVFLLYDSWEQQRARDLMAKSLDNFTEAHKDEMKEIGRRHQRDVERAVAELKRRPPDFYPIEEAIKREEEERLRLAEEERKKKEDEASGKPTFNPMDTLRQEEEKWRKEKERLRGFNATSPANTSCVRNIRRILLPQSDDFIAIVKEEIADYQHSKFQSLNFPKANVNPPEDGGDGGGPFGPSTPSKFSVTGEATLQRLPSTVVPPQAPQAA